MKIEKGTKLIAIDPCEMEDEEGNSTIEKALIVGKEYIVLRIDEDRSEGICIVIQSEIDDSHYFETASLKDYFTFPENNTDSSL